MARKARNPLNDFPVTVIIDTREALPYSFKKVPTDADEAGEYLNVRTVRSCLTTGDYSVLGHERAGIAIERKSAEDLYGTVSRGRERFEAEMVRMQEFNRSFVVVESELSMLLNHPPIWTRYSPKSLFRTILAFQVRYPKTHWLFLPSREVAEIVVCRALERYLLEVGTVEEKVNK